MKFIIIPSEPHFLASFRIFKNIFVTTFFVHNNSLYFPSCLDSCCFPFRFCGKEFSFSGSGLNYFQLSSASHCNLKLLVVQPVQLYFASFSLPLLHFHSFPFFLPLERLFSFLLLQIESSVTQFLV